MAILEKLGYDTAGIHVLINYLIYFLCIVKHLFFICC